MFEIENSSLPFKVGITKNPWVPEGHGFCDFTEGFGYYSKGCTWNGSPDSGFLLKIPNLDEEFDELDTKRTDFLA